MKIELSITLDIDTTAWDNNYNIIDQVPLNAETASANWHLTVKKLMIEDVKQHFNNSVYEHYNSLGVLKE
tara:strand:- start:32 stop:241 length:210 start_codon:yes stop_codon:yes gene_type:complete